MAGIGWGGRVGHGGAWQDRGPLWAFFLSAPDPMIPKTNRKPNETEQPEAHRKHNHDIQNRFQLRLHRNHGIHDVQDDADNNDRCAYLQNGHGTSYLSRVRLLTSRQVIAYCSL